MNFTTGFYQTDLSVHYELKNITSELKKRSTFWETDSNFYRIFYQYKGKSEFVIGSEKQIATNGTLIIAKPKDLLLFKPCESGEYEYILIAALPSCFSVTHNDRHFLRTFNKDKNKELIFNPISFKSNLCYSLLENFKECLINHSSRIHIEARLFSIISELDFIYDEHKNESNSILNTDNLSANLVDYLMNHCTEKITLENLEKMFFVSSTTLNRLCKNAMNMTVMEFVQIKRLNLANEIIRNNKSISFSKVALLCGFSDYSVFFKAYKKRFKVSPKQFRDGF